MDGSHNMPPSNRPTSAKLSKPAGLRAKLQAKLARVEGVSTSSAIPSQDNAASQTSQILPNTGSQNLSNNDDLWRKAQLIVENDSGWNEFGQEFAPNTMLVSIDVILSRFRQAQGQIDVDKWKIPISRNGKYIVPRDAFDRVVECANTFKQVGADEWEVAVKNKEAHDLVQNLEPLAYLMGQSSVFVELYLGSPNTSQSTKSLFGNSVQGVYVAVLRYLIASWKFQKQKKFGHAWHAIVRPETLQDAMKKVNETKAAMLEIQQVADAEGNRLTKMRMQVSPLTSESAVANDLSENALKLKAMLHNLTLSVQQVSQDVNEIRERQKQQDAERLQAKVLDKISTFPYAARYEQVLQQRMDSTLGSGKSTLTATVIEAMVNKNAPEYNSKFHLVYQFCDGTLQQSQTPAYTKSVLAALLRQLYQSSPTDVSSFTIQRVLDDQQGPLNLDEYESYMLDFLKIHPTIIIIDAFDEAGSESRNSLLKIMKRLKEKASTLKIFISSRTVHKIKKFLKKSKTIQVQNQADIELYIRRKIASFIEFREDLKVRFEVPRLGDILQKKASGMFRWIQMALQVILPLKGLPPKDPLKALEDLPSDLRDLYQQIFQRIQDELDFESFEIVRKTLSMLMYQEVTLQTRPFITGIISRSRLNDIKNPKAFIIDVCADLVEYDDNQDIFRLAHFSVRSFLEEKPEFGSLQGNSLITRICLDYLEKRIALEKHPTSWKLGSFLCYSLIYWPWHALFAFHLGRQRLLPTRQSAIMDIWKSRVARLIDYYAFKTYIILVQDSDQCSNSINKLQWSLLESYMQCLRQDQSHGHKLKAFLGDLQSAISEDEYSKSPTSEKGRYATSDRHQERSFLGISITTLQTDAPFSSEIAHDIDSQGRWDTLGSWRSFRCSGLNPLYAMLYWNLIVELVDESTTFPDAFWSIQRNPMWLEEIDHDGDIREVKSFETIGPPLGIFCHTGDYVSLEKVIPLIPASAFDTCRVNPPLGSTLINSRLNHNERECVIKALISKGASAQETALEQTYSIIHKAVADNHADVARLLLEHGAGANTTSWNGDTPLHQCALSRDPDKMMEVLFKHNADVTMVDMYGNTILHYLAANVYLRYISDTMDFNFLDTAIAKGLSVDSRNLNGRTPLHIAAMLGNPAMVKKLLASSALVDAQDVFRRTPLHYAANLRGESVIEDLLSARYIDMEDFAGASPLALSIIHNDGRAVQELLSTRLGENLLVLEGQFSALQLAAHQNNHGAAILLVVNQIHFSGEIDKQIYLWYKEAATTNSPPVSTEIACQNYHKFFKNSNEYSKLEGIIATLKGFNDIEDFDIREASLESRDGLGDVEDEGGLERVLNNISASYDCNIYLAPPTAGKLDWLNTLGEDSDDASSSGASQGRSKGEDKEQDEGKSADEFDTTSSNNTDSDGDPEDSAEDISEAEDSERGSQSKDDNADAPDSSLGTAKAKRNPIKAMYFELLGAKQRAKMEEPSRQLARRIAHWLETKSAEEDAAKRSQEEADDDGLVQEEDSS
ncbi:MAG: hypothetical protein Q9227_004822 [Pyrenula ochraceoflavens]